MIIETVGSSFRRRGLWLTAWRRHCAIPGSGWYEKTVRRLWACITRQRMLKDQRFLHCQICPSLSGSKMLYSIKLNSAEQKTPPPLRVLRALPHIIKDPCNESGSTRDQIRKG
jgi:hypothetical protein